MSVNQLAKFGDEIRGYIQQIASNTTKNVTNDQKKEKLATMEAKIRKLTETMTALTVTLNKELQTQTRPLETRTMTNR